MGTSPTPIAHASLGARQHAKGFTRRLTGLIVAAALMATPMRRADAEDLVLPPQVEAGLTANVAAYDRALVERAGDKVVIAIVAKPSDASSARAAAQMQSAFRELADVGGLRHEEFIVAWTDGSALSELCTRRKASIVFLTPGLDGEIDPIVAALQHLRVLSVAGVLSYVSRGLVLGFDLVSGRPKIVINLPIAKKQGLAFRASLLKLARIIE
jgi:hypothetical protein